MESDVAAEVVKRVETSKDVVINTLIMDDDTTTIARIRAELSHEITKLSDISHVKVHLRNSLHKLQSRFRVLSTCVIRYLVDKCFSYALLQNKDDTDGLVQSLNNIVPHVFGCHENCGSWCKHNLKQDGYFYKYLPNGRPLQGTELRQALVELFTSLSENAEKISACASSSQCESFNNMVAAKAPKNVI